MKVGTLIGTALVMIAETSFAYDTLVWTGKYNNNFNTTDNNWTNLVTGAETRFVGGSAYDQTGENIIFRIPAGDDVKVTINQSNSNGTEPGTGYLNPATLLFDIDGTFELTNLNDAQFLDAHTGMFTKRGAGKLILSSPGNRLFMWPYKASFEIEDGEVEVVRDPSKSYCMFDNWGACPINIGAGATFTLKGQFFNSTVNNYNKVPTHTITVGEGATFRLNSNGAAGYEVLPALVFNGGIFDYSKEEGMRSSLYCGLFSLPNKVTLGASQSKTPYAWTMDGRAVPATSAVNLWDAPLTEFDVADVTEDETVDFTIGLELRDRYSRNNEASRVTAGFVKSGSGTMALTNHLNRFSGDIEVWAGTLQIGPTTDGILNAYNYRSLPNGTSWIGSQKDARTITVNPGATLYLPHRNLWGSFRPITNDTCGVTTVSVQGGTLLNRTGVEAIVPNLTVTGGSVLFPNVGSGGYGVCMVANTFKVEGATPFEWPWADSSPSLVSSTGFAVGGYPETVFDIDDVTSDSVVDATIHLPFIINYFYLRTDENPGRQLNDWLFGFKKIGAGTLRLTGPSFTREQAGSVEPLNGVITIAEGCLQVDGGMFDKTSNIVVNASGALAGTGTVNNVTFAEGAGFRSTLAGTDVMTALGGCSFGATGTVDLDNPDSLPLGKVSRKLLCINGSITGGGNLENWTVRVNGVIQPDMHVSLSRGVLRASTRSGLRLIFR